MPPADSRYVNVRVPKKEYEKLKKVRSQLSSNPKYSWVESLALGALVGFVAGMVIEEITKK